MKFSKCFILCLMLSLSLSTKNINADDNASLKTCANALLANGLDSDKLIYVQSEQMTKSRFGMK